MNRLRGFINFLPLVLLAILLPAPVQADTLWTRSSAEAKPVKMTNVRIIRVQNGMIVYEILGREKERPLTTVVKIALDDEAAFTAAEDAYETRAWDKAADAYQRAIRITSRPWVKDWSSIRLLESANQSGRFDAFVIGYVALLLKDPGLVKDTKPTLPEAKSPYLATAATEVSKALASAKLSDVQKQMLLVLQLDIQRTRGEYDAAGKTAEQIVKLNPAAANDPAVVRSLADLKLGKAHAALSQKNYAQVVDEIHANRALFVDPEVQADALFCLACAQEGLVAGKNDPNALKDTALAFMRVVAHCKNLPDKPHVAESLMKTAAFCEKLNDPKAAIQLYEQVAAEFPDQPVGQTAKENAERLKSK